MRRALAVLTGTASLLALGAAPASAAPRDGMRLACQDGPTLTRSNGSSWWDVGSGAVYVTTHLHIEYSDGRPSFDKAYGDGRPRTVLTCVAQHGPFPGEDGWSVWTVRLAPAG